MTPGLDKGAAACFGFVAGTSLKHPGGGSGGGIKVPGGLEGDLLLGVLSGRLLRSGLLLRSLLPLEALEPGAVDPSAKATAEVGLIIGSETTVGAHGALGGGAELGSPKCTACCRSTLFGLGGGAALGETGGLAGGGAELGSKTGTVGTLSGDALRITGAGGLLGGANCKAPLTAGGTSEVPWVPPQKWKL